MSKIIQAVRGMNDILPDEAELWSLLEASCRRTAALYGYREIRFPIVEQTALFHRAIGEVTDIVEKEMYSFADRNGDSLSLRPEGTAVCIRAGIEHGLFYNQVQRLWYLGPMFRHERPQKGRCRQFHQFGVEAYGMVDAEIDVEIILLSRHLLQELGILDEVELQLNTLGSSESRNNYRETLVAYFKEHQSQLDEDSQRRLQTNPLRILDSKNPKMQELIEAAPKLMDFIDEDSRKHFERVCFLLDQAGVNYVLNARLVRGLDYYGLTVFEWVTQSLGAQGAVCGGGRYNTLVERLGDRPTPAIGFAMGIERAVALLEQKLIQLDQSSADVCMILLGDDALLQGVLLAEQLRQVCGLRVLCNFDQASFKSQFKRADKSGAHWALIMAQEELAKKIVIVKDLKTGEQSEIKQDAVVAYFENEFLDPADEP